MPTCFVIQPFDASKYDKRFEDVYSPAIIATGLEPYRVDRDPGVDVPIDAIEGGIRSAALCLPDITSDNPNVWYELGFAFATGPPVVMVCSDERTARSILSIFSTELLFHIRSSHPGISRCSNPPSRLE